jgi:hypothetical protein
MGKGPTGKVGKYFTRLNGKKRASTGKKTGRK